jgi:hypothetical protein
MNTKYFSYVADYVPNSGAFPKGKHWIEFTIKDTQERSEVFKLHIEEAPLSRGEVFSFRIKSGGLAGSLLPGWLFLTAEAVGHIEWGPVSDKAGHAVLQLPPGEELP